MLDSASTSLSEKHRDQARTAKSHRPGAQPLAPILDTDKTGILFTGNPHEAFPRRLLLDNRLTPLERNAWQVFRLLLNDDWLTSFPTYEQLRPYLASSPFKLASRETVAKALTALRLTRWLSLAGRVRDDVTGQMKGNIYLLHDEPISVSEAMLLDKSYLELVANAQDHANKSIRQVAALTLDEVLQDPHLREQTLPSHLEVLQQRVANQGWAKSQPKPTTSAHQSEPGPSESELSKNQSELSEKHPVRNRAAPSSDSEPSGKPGPCDPVRNPNSSSTSTYTNTSVCKSSVPRTSASSETELPEAFEKLPPEQQQKALAALAMVSSELRKSVLDQWATRYAQNLMRNPFGYLLGMIEKARNGEFNVITGVDPARKAPAATTSAPRVKQGAPSESKPHNPTDNCRAVASKEMASIMQMMAGRKINAGANNDKPDTNG
ncbi:MAG: STY4528 family pathogenicity island replication protein [Pseudomonas sp.]